MVFRAAVVEVLVRVISTNRNPPYFTQDVYSVSVREDAGVGTVVLTLQVNALQTVKVMDTTLYMNAAVLLELIRFRTLR